MIIKCLKCFRELFGACPARLWKFGFYDFPKSHVFFVAKKKMLKNKNTAFSNSYQIIFQWTTANKRTMSSVLGNTFYYFILLHFINKNIWFHVRFTVSQRKMLIFESSMNPDLLWYWGHCKRLLYSSINLSSWILNTKPGERLDARCCLICYHGRVSKETPCQALGNETQGYAFLFHFYLLG